MPRTVTKEVIAAYLACKYKGHLKVSGEQGSPTEYELLLREIDKEVRLNAMDILVARHPGSVVDRSVDLSPTRLTVGSPLILDAIYQHERLALTFDAIEKVEDASNAGAFHYIPIVYFGGERIRRAQRDKLGLFGLILGDMQGRQPSYGLIVHGAGAKIAKVSLSASTRTMRRLLKEIVRQPIPRCLRSLR